MRFQELSAYEQDQAARAGVALAVRRLDRAQGGQISTKQIGVVADRVLGDRLAFPGSSVARWIRYANGVKHNIDMGQKSTNRLWQKYPQAVREAAILVGDLVSNEIAVQ